MVWPNNETGIKKTLFTDWLNSSYCFKIINAKTNIWRALINI